MTKYSRVVLSSALLSLCFTASVQGAVMFDEPGTQFNVQNGPRSLAAGDVNGDGNTDLVVANRGSNNISVLIGDGAGSFAAAVNYGTGSNTQPRWIKLADLEGDGDLDAVTANANGNNVSVMLNDGTGNFSNRTNYSAGTGVTGPRSLDIGDVDNDGDLDILVAAPGSEHVSVIKQLDSSPGSFTGAGGTLVFSPAAPSGGVYSIAAGELNGDGNLDFVLVRNDASSIFFLKVCRGDGTGLSSTYSDCSANITLGSATVPEDVALGDMNNDGKLDAVVVTNATPGNGNAGLVYLNGAPGNADVYSDSGSANFKTFNPGTNAVAVALADVDGDGNLDVIVANASTDDIVVLAGDGNGNVETIGSPNFLDAGNPGGGTLPEFEPNMVVTGDFNADGKPDIAAANASSGTAGVNLNLKASSVAADVSVTTAVDTAASDSFSATNADGEFIFYSIVTNPTNGTVVVDDTATGAFTYTPNTSFEGTDTFTYKADRFAATDTNTGTVTVTVGSGGGANNAPVLVSPLSSGTLTLSVGGSQDIQFSVTDDSGDTHTYNAIWSTSNTGTSAVGTASFTGDTLTVTATAAGSDVLVVTATDNGGLTSTPVNINVTVNAPGANTAPVASDGTLAATGTATATGMLSATDADGNTLVYSIVTNGTLGNAVIIDANTGEFAYAASNNTSGTDTFTFKANDGTEDSNVATITVTITASSSGGGGGGGGCTLASSPMRGIDPVLPLLLLVAVLYLRRSDFCSRKVK